MTSDGTIYSKQVNGMQWGLRRGMGGLGRSQKIAKADWSEIRSWLTES